MIHPDETDPGKPGGRKDPEVVGFAKAFVKVGLGGDEEVTGPFLGYRGRRVIPLLHLQAHHGEAEAVDQANTDKDQRKVVFGRAEDVIVEKDTGDKADGAKNSVEAT